MKGRYVARMLILALAVAGMCSSAVAQDSREVLQARSVIVKELVESIPARLPDGAVAVLPPRVEDPPLVDARALESWPTAVEEAIHMLRSGLTVVDRAHLAEILREQKFGDSAYADPKTAARVGKLVSARMLFLTRIHELRLVNGKVRVSLEASLVDVKTGENLWSRTLQRGIFPAWAKVIIAVFLLVVALLLLAVFRRRWKKKLVHQTVPRAKEKLHVDVGGVAAAAMAARQRLQEGSFKEGAQAVQRAWQGLDPVLDRVRHALPGGAMDRSRIRDLRGATAAAKRMEGVLSELRLACDGLATGDEGGRQVAREMERAAMDLREALDQYRRFLA